MENINIMCTPGYPMSGGTAASKAKVVHQVTTVAFKRDRFATAGVTGPQIADLPSVVSATTSERRT